MVTFIMEYIIDRKRTYDLHSNEELIPEVTEDMRSIARDLGIIQNLNISWDLHTNYVTVTLNNKKLLPINWKQRHAFWKELRLLNLFRI